MSRSERLNENVVYPLLASDRHHRRHCGAHVIGNVRAADPISFLITCSNHHV